MNYSNLVYTGINSAATWYICYSLVLSDIKYRSKNELSLYYPKRTHNGLWIRTFFGCHQMIVLLEVSWGCKIILKSFSSVMHFIESVEKRYDIQTLYDRLHCLVRVTTCQKKILNDILCYSLFSYCYWRSLNGRFEIHALTPEIKKNERQNRLNTKR